MSDIYQIINVDKTRNDCIIMHARNYNGTYLVIDENLGDYKVGQDIELWPQYEYRNGYLTLTKLIVPPTKYAELKKQVKEVRNLLDKIEEGIKQWGKGKISQ
jgi:hypothetical protein